MGKFKKIMALSLAAFIALSPVSAIGEDLEEVNIISVEEEVQVEIPNYIEFTGEITELNTKEEFTSILVENDLKEGQDKLIVHITDEVIVLEDESTDFISKEDLEKGMEVSIYYHKETPVLMSYPAQVGPDVVVVRNREDTVNITIDTFDNELTSDDGSMRINIHEDTEIIDIEGNEVSKDELGNKDLILFYTHIMESYPVQIRPEKIIVLRNNEPEVMDKVIINDKEISLDNSIYKNEEGFIMIPLRQITEELGYKVEWDHDTKSVELTKESQWTKITIGEDNYNFAKMLVELGIAPELTDSKTYVPVSFLKEILMAHVEYTMDGVLKITQYY